MGSAATVLKLSWSSLNSRAAQAAQSVGEGSRVERPIPARGAFGAHLYPHHLGDLLVGVGVDDQYLHDWGFRGDA